MKRHHMAMAAGDGGYGDGTMTTVAGQTHIATPHETRRATLGPPDERPAPPGAAAREHTLILTGELDGNSANALEAEIERLCEEGVTQITLDLSQLAQIDPVGVAVIAFRCRLCQRRGFGFALIPGGRAIQRAFEQVGVAGLLPFRAGEPASACSSDDAVEPARDSAKPARAPTLRPEPALALALGNGVETSYAR
jgi:anti-anti-sigma factor